jgi:hypothetical protein
MGVSIKGARADKLEHDRFKICARWCHFIKAAPLFLVQFDSKLQ